MKIELMKVTFNNTYLYKYKPFEYCCDDFKDNDSIIFTDENFIDFDEVYCDKNYKSIPQFCTTKTIEESSFDEVWDVIDNYPIRYCPHCGEKIEISIADEIDLSSEYSELKSTRKSAFCEANETDSKKKEAELREKVRKLDKRINWFWQVSEYNGEYKDEEKI